MARQGFKSDKLLQYKIAKLIVVSDKNPDFILRCYW
jgi:hypothetical protein